MTILPKFFVFASVATISMCDKPDKLRAEQAKYDAERAALISESEAYAKQFTQMVGASGVSLFKMNQLMEDTTKRAAILEAQATAKMKKWLEIEAGLKVVRGRADAWKAKNLK